MRIGFIFMMALASQLSAETNYLQTSVSDASYYRDFCAEAVADPAVFKNFRSHYSMIYVVELRYEHLGWEYLQYINLYYPFLLDQWKEFRKSDEVGGPPLFDYGSLGTFSPNTLRYIKILGDLTSFFGDLSGWSIAEIGGGFGGQCRILNSYFPLKNYSIIDLPEPLLLAEKYLSSFDVENIQYIQNTDLEEIFPDLVISNYAFSELQRYVQDEYFDKVIRNSKAGYMTLNPIRPFPGWTHSFEEIYRKLEGYGFEVTVTDEYPLSSPDNKLCIWKRPS